LNFQRIDPSAEYRVLRLRSSGGRWELGFSDYRDGMRIRMGLSERPPSVIDFCLGHDASLYAPVLEAVLNRLKLLEESACAEDIDALFPWSGTRPDPPIHLPALLKSMNSCP
jgi:hypothetical protein